MTRLFEPELSTEKKIGGGKDREDRDLPPLDGIFEGLR